MRPPAPTQQLEMDFVDLSRVVAQERQGHPMAARRRLPVRKGPHHVLGVEHEPNASRTLRLDMTFAFRSFGKDQAEPAVEVDRFAHVGNNDPDRVQVC